MKASYKDRLVRARILGFATLMAFLAPVLWFCFRTSGPPGAEVVTQPQSENHSVAVQNPPQTKGGGMNGEEQLRRDVASLATSAGREVGSPGHEAARSYLLDRIRGLGLSPYSGASFELLYEENSQRFVNVLGVLPGVSPALPPLLLAAHYDTCGPYPGADDNAAAVAILLALAERWKNSPPKRSVVFAFFDAEEPPYFQNREMGSTYFYHHQRTAPVHCAIALDLVGHDFAVAGLEDVVVVTGMESDPAFAEVLKRCDTGPKLRMLPTLNRYIGDLSDHHVFRLERRPYLFVTCARWKHYHQPTDTPEKLNYAKMAALVEYLTRITEAVCETDLTGPFEGYDTTDTELFLLRRALGPFLDALGAPLNNRRDIDGLVAAFMMHVGL